MAKTPFHCEEFLFLFFFFGEEFLMKHCDYVPLRKGGVSIILNMLGLFEYVRHIFEYVLV